MPNEDDKIGDLSRQLEETTSAEEDSEIAESRPAEALESADADVAQTGSRADGGAEEPHASEDQAGGPPFGFDETDMHGFYVRDATWDGVARTRSAVAAVCSTFGVSEFEGREFQDACLRVVGDQGAEVALKILEERDIEADEERIAELMELLTEQPAE